MRNNCNHFDLYDSKTLKLILEYSIIDLNLGFVIQAITNIGFHIHAFES